MTTQVASEFGARVENPMAETDLQLTICSSSKGDASARPVLRERREYVPLWPQEQFIVPLLRQEIDFCIARYATPALGGRKAVDIGCGGQPYRKALEEIGYTYCGVDASATDAPDIVCAIDEPLPAELLGHAPFDFVLCTEVLEHVADWGGAFANFDRLLTPGGRALITAPHFYQLHEEPFDFWRPTLHAIDRYARQVRLEPIYRSNAGGGWDVLGTLLSNCSFVGASPRLFDRALAKAVRASVRLALRALVRGRIQRFVRADGPLYLSNIAVLEKPKAAE